MTRFTFSIVGFLVWLATANGQVVSTFVPVHSADSRASGVYVPYTDNPQYTVYRSIMVAPTVYVWEHVTHCPDYDWALAVGRVLELFERRTKHDCGNMAVEKKYTICEFGVDPTTGMKWPPVRPGYLICTPTSVCPQLCSPCPDRPRLFGRLCRGR